VPAGGGGGDQVPDGTNGLPGDLVQSRGDLGAGPLVAVLGHRAGGDGRDRAERAGQVLGDGIEDVLVAPRTMCAPTLAAASATRPTVNAAFRSPPLSGSLPVRCRSPWCCAGGRSGCGFGWVPGRAPTS
jgi:hypothetical protein